MKKVFFKTISCISLSALTAFAPTPTTQKVVAEQTPVPASNICFQDGEELTYKLYYNLNFVWVPAGEATFRVAESGNQFKFSAIGKSYGSYDWFFKVRDYYYTDADKATLLPTRSVRDVTEGGYRLYDAVSFNHKKQTAQFERGDAKDKIATKGTLNLSGAIHDVVSVLYYTRSLDYAKMGTGSSFPVKVMLDEHTYPLNVKFLGKETKVIKDLGKFKTLKVSPQLVAGAVFNEGTQMKIWATDDDNKIPLLIESPVSVGAVKVILKSYSGLKNPMTSKIP
jgi:hypothetical protein